jgi:peptide/nickel transport system substrate-binding protein
MEKSSTYFLGVASDAPNTVRLRYGLEAATVRTLIAQGKHDISSQWLPPEVMGALAKEGAQLFSESGTGAFYLKLNTTKAPLDDVNCRLALANAFDYESVVKMIAINDEVSSGRAATGAIPVGMFGSNPVGQELKQDMAAAKQHLANCKYDAGDHTLELSWIAEVALEERIALLMLANFTELGFKGEIKKLPWALFAEQVSKPENTPHVSQLFVNAVTGDPDTLIYGMYHSSNPGTWQSPEYLDDAAVDVLLDAGRSVTSASKREQVYAGLNNRLMAIAASVYAFDRQSIFAASNRVSAPALTNPADAFGLDGMGFSFRLMSVKD